MSDDAYAILCLSRLPGIGYATIQKLLVEYHTYQGILNNYHQWQKKPSAVPDLDNFLKSMRAITNKLQKLEIHYLTFIDSLYPSLLKNISTPPLVLYYQGNIQALHEKCLAVVGTRKPTPYSKQALAQLLPAVCDAGVHIVSGFQLGVDQQAHQIAVQQKQPTIAVLGTGLNIDYPHGSKALRHQILAAGGLIISEYPPDTTAQPYHFPIRNRIVSGVSQAVLVIEAALKSGSLNTVSHALEQGREVWAVPGPITSTVSAGTNYLIQQGARIALDSYEILSFYGFSAKSTQPKDLRSIPEPLQKIYIQLTHKSQSIDELLLLSGLGYAQLLEQLSQLELLGHVTLSEQGEYFAI
ncbi:MAG: DNA polymerase III [Patescibacteria group bacterium]|nr:MAG: DNA polymerase III [Patescibacteria group bacterium]